MRIRINGMSCSHCQARVEKGLSELDGVTSVRVDLPTGTATVVGDVTEDRLRTTLDDLGYEYGGKLCPLPPPERTARPSPRTVFWHLPSRLFKWLYICSPKY